MWILPILVTGNMESKLINDLFKEYPKYARPVRNSSDIVNVLYDFSYTEIDLDEVSNIQTLIVYEGMYWKDEFLVWNPDIYEGMDELRIDANTIWIPDMTPYNTANDVDAEHGRNTAIIGSDGNVGLIRTMKIKVRCIFHTHYFPFDSATCLVIMGSWTYSSAHMNLSLTYPEVALGDYRHTPRWKLVNATLERQAKTYPCCKDVYYSITFKNEFARISYDFVLALLVPSYILSVLTILLFMLPNYGSEKITFAILLFCAFFVILLYTNSVLPAADTTPYFVIFLIFNLIMLSLLTIINALVVNLSNCESCQEVPKFLRSIVIDGIAKRFCMTSIVNRNKSRHLMSSDHESDSQMRNFYKFSVSSDKQPLNLPTAEQSYDKPLNAEPGLESNVAFITAFTSYYWQNVKDGEAEKRFRQGWSDIGQVINRFLCVLYIPVVLIAVGVNLIQISSK